MENNKLLIGVQFIDKTGTDRINIELYVLRDLLFEQLLDGIKYGVTKLAESNTRDAGLYKKCKDIFSDCICKIEEGAQPYYSNLTFTSYNFEKAKEKVRFEGGLVNNTHNPKFFLESKNVPICDLGFITSTILIFDIILLAIISTCLSDISTPCERYTF